ncbi:hypothetical protein [Melittangium boletus]|uniref:Lipoprotein n=1 Tax=Melittangium boletus DSM 14713 TaxID=1294270 RepID=A0A250IMG1_9BACT|nr:hypothetical protein [Melittangium boletus]ATB32924.1 hypothetical protein MEBOL_006413 [Melittangium boletus DSM 14713]
MNTGRFALRCCTTVLVPLALAACGGGAPGCSQCPPIEGTYALALGTGTTPSSCQGVTVTLPRGPLEVRQQGGTLSGDLDGLPLSGTVYETGEFNLLGNRLAPVDGGTAGPESVSLSGRYVPAVGDGGVPLLEGEWLGNFASTSSGTVRRCAVARPFTATRQ